MHAGRSVLEAHLACVGGSSVRELANSISTAHLKSSVVAKDHHAGPPIVALLLCQERERTGGRTDGLHMDAHELRAARLGLMHAHVPGDALSSGCIVDGYQPLPLLHRTGDLRRDIQALLLDLGVEAVEVQVDNGAMVGMQALPSPADLHVTCE